MKTTPPLVSVLSNVRELSLGVLDSEKKELEVTLEGVRGERRKAGEVEVPESKLWKEWLKDWFSTASFKIKKKTTCACFIVIQLEILYVK